jgi:hypothetical protein
VLRKDLFLSSEYGRLSPAACKVLLRVHLQYTLRNNGNLTITANEFRGYGFKSKATLWKAKDELVAAGWLQVTRQGGLHYPSLYALTWESIDAGAQPYDPGVRIGGPPSNLWRDENKTLRDSPKPMPAPSKRGFASRRSTTRTTSPPVTDHVAPRHGASVLRIAPRHGPK